MVKSLTFDGPTKNIATAKKLGCDINNLEGFFVHPCRPDLKVYIILDICHMLKLARNALGDMQTFLTPQGDKISWQFIMGNKLKTKHIQWQKQEMKVFVAAQTLSSSVACAINI